MNKILLAFALFCGVVFCDSCVSVVPNLPSGANCGGSIGCQRGLYCGPGATCTAQIAVGSSCNATYGSPCVVGANCLGPIGNAGSQTCVANANPGETCTSNSTISVPLCGNGLSCVLTNFAAQTGYCTGGGIGDACQNSSDCTAYIAALNCTAGVCAAIPIGGTCNVNSFNFCILGSSCAGGVCTAFLNPGQICSGTSALCSPGYFCIGTTPQDTSPVCVQNQTRTAGQYCNGFDDLCQNTRKCGGSFYCTKVVPDQCNVGGQSSNVCSPSQACICDGAAIQAGIGNCISDPCYTLRTNFQACLTANCGPSATVNGVGAAGLTYTSSCVMKNCATMATTFFTCSDAGRLLPNLAMILAFFALILPNLAKHF